VLALIVVSLSIVTLAYLASEDPRSLLWIPPEATILRPAAVYRSGNAEVSFTVPLPEFDDRDVFTARLTKQIETSGWRRRRWQYLNPTHPLSFEWETAGGGLNIARDHPKRTVDTRKWMGEWDDADGNVLQYSLLAIRVAEGPGHNIRAFAGYFPAELVRAGVNGNYR
jgi:hypothetical protein